MANSVPPLVLAFTILCLAFVSNALADDFISNYDVSSKDPDENVSPSALSSKHPSRKVILPSAWSKEENKHLEPSDDKNIENEEQGILSFGEDFNLWNIKKLFQYVASFLPVVNQNNDGSLDKSIDDFTIKILNPTNNGLPDKSENNGKDELRNSANTITLNKSNNDGKMQNPSSTDTQYKSSDNGEKETLWNGGSSEQTAKNSKIQMQNSVDENSLHKSTNDMKTETRNLAVIESVNKLANGEEMQNFESNNILNKNSDDLEKQNSSNNTQPKENSEIKVKNSRNKNFYNEPETTAKTELQDPVNTDYFNKSADYVKLQNSETNDSVNKSLDNVKMQNSASKHSSNTQHLTKDSKNKIQNHMHKDYLNEPTENIKIQNPSNNDIQRESISALTSDKSKDLKTVTFEDDENSNMNEITSDDTKAYDTSEGEADEYDVYNDDEKENEDDADEYDTNENELDDDYGDDYDNGDNTNQNNVEDDYLNENNYNEYNDDKNEVDDYVNKSKSDNDENKAINSIKTHETPVTVDKKAPNTTNIFPKFMIQTVPDQPKNSETYPSRNKINKNDNVTPEDANYQTITNEENSSPKSELNGGEFIDDYINNHRGKISERQNEQSKTTEAVIPNGNDAKSKIISIQIPTSGNNFQESNGLLITNSFVNENTKNQNMLFEQSQNPVDNFGTEKNILPLTNYNEDTKNANPDQASPNENSQNTPNTPAKKPSSSALENTKANEVTPQRLIPFQEKPNYIDLPYTFTAPHEDYNVFTEPTTLKFQNNNPSAKVLHDSAPNTNVYWPETKDPFQLIFNKAVPLQDEGYLTDQYTNFFDNGKSSAIIDNKNKQLEQKQPIILKPDIPSNVQYVPNQDTPNSPDEAKYFENYRPEMPMNPPNVETPAPVMEIPSNYWFSDNLQYNPSFNQLYNQEPSFTDNENSLIKTDKIKQFSPLKQDMLSNVQNAPNQDTPNSPDKTKYFTNYRPEMSMNVPNIETPVPVTEMPSNYWISDNLQYNPSFNQLYNQESSFTNNENSLIKTDKIVPQVQPDATALQDQIDKIKTINVQSQVDNLPSQNIFSGQQILFPQSVTEKPLPESKMNSRTQPDENKITSEIFPTQDKFKNIELLPSQNNANNSKVLPVRSFNITEVNLENKPGNVASSSDIPKHFTTKSFFPETKITSSKPLNGEFEKSIFFDEAEGYNQEISFVDFYSSKSDNYGESSDCEYDEDESYESEYDAEESYESEYDEESYESEYDEEELYESEYDEESYESEYDEEESYDSEYDEGESYESEYDEEKSYESEYDDEESYESEYDEDESYEREYYEEESQKSTYLSSGMINDATMQKSQKSSTTNANDVTKSLGIFQTQREAVPSNQKGNFNTILEYIYKFSDNPLFKSLKD